MQAEANLYGEVPTDPAVGGRGSIARRQQHETTVPQSIALLMLVVRDYEEALAFFTDALRFDIVEDWPLSAGKRWVVVAPPGLQGACLLLAQAASGEQEAHIGNQTGGRVFLFLETSDFWNDYRDMRSRGVKFAEEPRQEPYGTVAVFFDLYGNKWDLLERNNA